MNINPSTLDEIELRHLRYFLAVADTLHFTRAAEQLGMAQPPLSQQIRKLENLIGHPLFLRTTRGVRLTPAGDLLATRARATFEKMRDDVTQVRRVGRGEEGTLTIGFAGSIMFTELPSAIQEFSQRYPNVELRLREMVTALQIGALLDRSIDLGFLRDGDPTEGLETLTLQKEPYVAVLPQSHSLISKSALRLADLSEEPFILFARHRGPLAYDRTLACCARAGFVPNIVQEAPQWPTVIRLVAAGIGVSLAPACLANLAIPGAVYMPVQPAGRTTVDAAMRVGCTCTLTHNFLSVARHHFRK